MDELIDCTTKDGELLGEVMPKSLVHERGVWHRCVHVWIVDEQGKFLFQRRSAKKNLYPSTLDVAAAGHCATGEEPLDAAMRELSEELGIVLPSLTFVRSLSLEYSVPGWKAPHREHLTVFVAQIPHATTLAIQNDEVESVQWITLAELTEGCTQGAPRSVFCHTAEYLAPTAQQIQKIYSRISL